VQAWVLRLEIILRKRWLYVAKMAAGGKLDSSPGNEDGDSKPDDDEGPDEDERIRSRDAGH
jgi:hypothetical protein